MVLTNIPSLGDVSGGSRQGGRTVVCLSGEYDIATLTALSDRLAAAIGLDDVDLVVDLTDVQFIDAATVGLFVRTRSFLGLRSRHLTLRNPARSVRRIVAALGLDDLLDSAPADAGWATSSSVLAPRAS